jgi:hypothetical protein
MLRPSQTDYDTYYGAYIELVTGENIVQFLEEQKDRTNKFLRSISEEDSFYSYAEGKWTIKQVVGHITDTERIMAYRALCLARKEKQHLPGFEEKDYAATGKFNSRRYTDLVDELKIVREANLPMVRSFDGEMTAQDGIVNNKRITVLALLYIIGGHQEHHLKIIKERYLSKKI